MPMASTLNAVPCSSTSSSMVTVQANSIAASLPRISLKQLCQIKSGGYFDLVAQIIGIFNCRESDRRILRVWDGTQPFIAITRIPQICEALPSGSYFAPLQDFLTCNQPKLIADIYIYDEHMPLCDAVKPGDVVHLRNLHSYWPKLPRGYAEDTISMHKDGARYNRGLTRLESTHPEFVKLMGDLCKIFAPASSPEIRHFTNPLSPPIMRSGSGQPPSVAGAARSGHVPILAVSQRTPSPQPMLRLANNQQPSASSFSHPPLMSPRQDSEAPRTDSNSLLGLANDQPASSSFAHLPLKPSRQESDTARTDTTPQSSPRRAVRFVSPQTNRSLLKISEQLPAPSRQNDPAAGQDAARLAVAIQPCAINGESIQLQNLEKSTENDSKPKLPAFARIRKTLRPNPDGPVANAEGESFRSALMQVIIAERRNRARAKKRRRRLRVGFEILSAARKIPKGTEEVYASSKIVAESQSELELVNDDGAQSEATLARLETNRKRKLDPPVSLSSSSKSSLLRTEDDAENDRNEQVVAHFLLHRQSDRTSAKKAALGAKKG